MDEYREQLERRLGKAREVMRVMIHKAQREPKRIVFPEGEEDKILRASQILVDEKIAHADSAGTRSSHSAKAWRACTCIGTPFGLSIPRNLPIGNGMRKTSTVCASGEA